MESKFWNRDNSVSSGGEDDDAESNMSDSGSEDEPSKKTVAVPDRWAAMDDSSSDEEERRVVRSAKDKRWDQLRQVIKAMKNHKNIDDFGELQSGFDSLIKGINKSKAIVEKEGFPSFFVRALVELEKYLMDKFMDKESLKRLSKGKSTSFNTLRSKVRKGLEPYRFLLDEYSKNPEAFADDEDDAFSSASSSDDDEDDMLSSDEDETEDDSESESGSEDDESGSEDESDDDESVKKSLAQRKKLGASDSDDDEWGESDSGEEVVDGGEDEAHQRVLKMWGKKEVSSGKTKAKKSKEKAPRSAKVPKAAVEAAQQQPQYGRGKVTSILQPGERVDAELLTKKLKEVTSLRGRKGFDRMEQIRHLNELLAAAKNVSPQSQMDVLGHLISAYFDANLGAFVAMPPTQWSQCCEGISNALCLLKEEKDCYFPFLVGEYDDEEANNDEQRTISEAEHDAVVASGAALASTSALLKARQKQHTQGDSKEGKAMLETALTLTRFLERLDDELVKALQLTDIHSEEYKLRLRHTLDLLILLWKAYMHFTRVGLDEYARIVSLRILEQIYYKNDDIAGRMWDLVKKQLDPEDTVLLVEENRTPSDIVRLLVNSNLSQASGPNGDVRLILYQAYSESLHGRFYEARDLLQISNIQELASQCNIATQIFFNRNLVQLGLAAFRLGLISEAHNYLSEVCAMGRYKELLAQGLSNVPRGTEKNPEQERLEKRRLLPYHMHIAADLVEAVHNICAMLLEVPYMAANPFDYSKKPIARNFRRLLEMYDRQMFTGPPENPRESIMAATKALQKGNWKACAEHVLSLKVLESLPEPEKVKDILTDRIKQEALRTYLLSYASYYDSFSTKQLADMFSLPTSTVQSLVSKMVIQGLLSGSWDEASECVLINRVERTPQQLVALQLTDKISQAVDQNETLLAYRNPKFVLSQANMRDDRNRRYDDRWGNMERRGFFNDFNRMGTATGNERPTALGPGRYIPGGQLPSRHQAVVVGSTNRRRW